MRASIVLASLLVAQLAAWSEEVEFDQLAAAVEAENLSVLRDWLTPERVASEDYTAQVANLFAQALHERRPKVVALMFQAGVELPSVESDTLDQEVYDIAGAGDEKILDLLRQNGWTPQLAFAADVVGTYTDETQDDYAPFKAAGQSLMDRLIAASLSDGNIRFLELCLDTGLDSNFRLYASGGESLLNQSIKVSSLPVFELLMQRNASITEVRDVDLYKTTLAIAIEYQGEQSEFVKLLKEKGAYRVRYSNPRPNYADSTTDRLRIRSSPDVSGKILGYLMKGDMVELLEVTPLSYLIDDISAPWIRVRHAEAEGWVFGGYLGRSDLGGQSP